MKNLMILLAALALAGCTPEPPKAVAPDPEIARLKARVVELEKGLNKLGRRLDAEEAMNRISSDQLDQLSTNLPGLMVSMSATTAALIEKVASHIESTNPHPRARGYFYAAPTTMGRPAVVAMTRGVPNEIFNRIKVNAQGKWGDRFDMVEYEIDKQVEAYKKVNP